MPHPSGTQGRGKPAHLLELTVAHLLLLQSSRCRSTPPPAQEGRAGVRSWEGGCLTPLRHFSTMQGLKASLLVQAFKLKEQPGYPRTSWGVPRHVAGFEPRLTSVCLGTPPRPLGCQCHQTARWKAGGRCLKNVVMDNKGRELNGVAPSSPRFLHRNQSPRHLLTCPWRLARGGRPGGGTQSAAPNSLTQECHH